MRRLFLSVIILDNRTMRHFGSTVGSAVTFQSNSLGPTLTDD